MTERRTDVLLADDNLTYVKVLAADLVANGLNVEITNSEDTLEMISATNPGLLVHASLDKTDISKLIREAQQKINGLPVVILTGTIEKGKLEPSEVTQTINKGAAHCLYKYTDPEVIAAYLRAIIRRGKEKTVGVQPAIQAGETIIDFEKRIIQKQDQLIYLSRTEWDLLTALGSQYQHVMLSSELLSKTWGPEYREDIDYLRVWLSRLRKKLGDNPKDPQIIMTVHDIGYMLLGEPIYQDDIN